MTVTWSEEVDDVLAGDMTAGLAYVTPAGGAVVMGVSPVGLRDREGGTVTFTTSLGFGRKLERIRREPRVALAYHAREHGFSNSPRYVLVQGRASFYSEPDERYLTEVVTPQAARFFGSPKRGAFWDRWLREYYRVRVPVAVAVERITSWPDLRCQGTGEVLGAPAPSEQPTPQSPPKNGTGPRVDSERAARRTARHPHRLLAFVAADGYPTVVPVDVVGASSRGIELTAAAGLLAAGGRRAGLVAHDYRAQGTGLQARQFTGWLEFSNGRALYEGLRELGRSFVEELLDSVGGTAWEVFSSADIVLLAGATLVLALTLFSIVTGGASIALSPAAAARLVGLVGTCAVGLVLWKMFDQPDPDVLFEIDYGPFVALVAAAAIGFGGWSAGDRVQRAT